MNITITGKELKATDAIKDYIEEKLARIKKYFADESIDVTVTIKKENVATEIAEMYVSVKGVSYKAVTEDKDLYASIDKDIDILEGQIRKAKTKREKMQKDSSIKQITITGEESKTIEDEVVKTAVSEAVTNCIIHGYDNKQGIVKINAKLKENEIIIIISDKGKGIENIDVAKEPLYTTKPNLERSGMGFTIMESFMDSMKVESVLGLGTKVTMSKIIKPKEEKEEEDFEMLIKD